MSDHRTRRPDPPEGVQPHPADLARMLEGVEERRTQPVSTDTPEEIRVWLAAREAQDETSDDMPRYAGLPLEEYERPTWYTPPAGCEFVDDFDFPDSGTFSMALVREVATGRLLLDIWHGDEWQHRLRLPLDVPADATSFGVLARTLAEGVPS